MLNLITLAFKTVLVLFLSLSGPPPPLSNLKQKACPEKLLCASNYDFFPCFRARPMPEVWWHSLKNAVIANVGPSGDQGRN